MTNSRRIALLTGACISVTAIPEAANAATVIVPGVNSVTVAADATNQLIISNIGPMVESGVSTDDVPTANAVVNTVPSGQIKHIGVANGSPPTGNVDLKAFNHGTAIVKAKATADSNTAGPNNAYAEVNEAILQSGTGSNVVALSLENDGTLNANASAVAASTGIADAHSLLIRALSQNGDGDLKADVTITNAAKGIIKLDAHADASADQPTAVATIETAIDQHIQTISGSATITNNGLLTVQAQANAKLAKDSVATATALIKSGLHQDLLVASGEANIQNDGSLYLQTIAQAFGGGGLTTVKSTLKEAIWQSVNAQTQAKATLINNELISIYAIAYGQGPGSPNSAEAKVEDAISQSVTLTGSGAGGASIHNIGNISISAEAMFGVAPMETSQGNAHAEISQGIVQHGVNLPVSLQNDGLLSIKANAYADSFREGPALAEAKIDAISQLATSAQLTTVTGAAANLVNTDNLIIAALADSKGDNARSIANIAHGVHQQAKDVGDVSVAAKSTSKFIVQAQAFVAAGFTATATASIESALGQVVNSTTGKADALFQNSGRLSVMAEADMLILWSADTKVNVPHAILQTANGPTASVKIENGGTIMVQAKAESLALEGPTVASSKARAIEQNSSGLQASASVVSGGQLQVTASAKFSSEELDVGYASAEGIFQNLIASVTATGSLVNDGQITVEANGEGGYGSGDNATIDAVAYRMVSLAGADTTNLDLHNNGLIDVKAIVDVGGKPLSKAIGMSINVGDGGSFTPLAGTIENKWQLKVLASAEDNDHQSSEAFATGIHIQSGSNEAIINNTGSLEVTATVELGGNASAEGILITSNSGQASAQTFTINNSGNIQSLIIKNSGASPHRGMAINVAEAPNKSVINLLKGTIYGNIDVRSGDQINVSGDLTAFDGIINPECMPPVNDGSSGCGQGSMAINGNGSMFMRNFAGSGMYDGPSYAFVASLDIATDGTIVFELPTTSTEGDQAPGSYPQIFAQTATLDGTLLVKPSISQVNFAEKYKFDNVIDTNALTGTFDSCDFFDTSSYGMFKIICVYDDDDNVDLEIGRIQMMAVAGLDANGRSIGAALERAYAPGSGRTMPGVVASLLPLSTEAYSRALNQLSGAAYANYLQSFGSLGLRFNEMIDEASDGKTLSLSVGLDSKLRFWGQQGAQTNNATQSNMAMRGVDLSLGNGTTAGFTLGKSASRMDDQGEGLARAEGAQVGAYAGFASGPFTMKAMAGFSRHDGELSRQVSFSPFGGALQGNADVSMWTLGLHTAAPIKLGSSSTLTPYLNLDAIGARMDGFSEAGAGSANLKILGGSQNQLSATAGLGWTGKLAGLSTQAKLGYRHQLGDAGATFRASLAGGPSFDIVSDERQRGSFLAGFSLGGKLGPADLRLSYDGELNGGRVEQRGSVGLSIPF